MQIFLPSHNKKNILNSECSLTSSVTTVTQWSTRTTEINLPQNTNAVHSICPCVQRGFIIIHSFLLNFSIIFSSYSFLLGGPTTHWNGKVCGGSWAAWHVVPPSLCEKRVDTRWNLPSQYEWLLWFSVSVSNDRRCFGAYLKPNAGFVFSTQYLLIQEILQYSPAKVPYFDSIRYVCPCMLICKQHIFISCIVTVMVRN